MSLKENLCSAKSILRFIELIFSIIVFACVAEYDGWDKVNFTLFTGITTMILCLLFLIIYAMGMRESATVALVELVIDVLWWIFWLSTAAVLSDIVANWDDRFGVFGGDKGKFQASCAFAWLTFFLWTATTAMSIMTLMKGKSSAGPPVPDPNAAPAVAMV